MVSLGKKLTALILVSFALTTCATDVTNKDSSMGNQLHGGMTVNERLAEMGLFSEWDKAVKSRSRLHMIEVLKLAGLDEGAAKATVDAVLANPALYGF